MGEKIIGIMGGMGPEAGADLFLKITAATPARTDQEHLHIILDSNPKTPSRPKALLQGGQDPTPFLQATARNLERAGADILVVACNTAHLFHDRIVDAVRIPVLHIADEAVAEIARSFRTVQAVGILAGNGAIRLRLYQNRLEAKGIRAISPSEEDQQIVAAVIRAVKSGDKGQAVRERIRWVADRLAAEGAQLVLTACTEVPLVLRDGEASIPVLDPTEVLARAAVRFARGE